MIYYKDNGCVSVSGEAVVMKVLVLHHKKVKFTDISDYSPLSKYNKGWVPCKTNLEWDDGSTKGKHDQ